MKFGLQICTAIGAHTCERVALMLHQFDKHCQMRARSRDVGRLSGLVYSASDAYIGCNISLQDKLKFSRERLIGFEKERRWI